MREICSPADFGFDPERFPSFRSEQFEVAERLASTEKRFGILSAPVGSGKSLSYLTVHKLLGGRMLVLVGNKGLQAQLENDFAHVGLYNISGHRNYSCAQHSYDNRSGEAEMECVWRDSCEYRKAVDIACKSDSVVTNIAHWVSLQKVGEKDRLGVFDLLVIDEAHLADMLLVGQLGVKVSGYMSELIGVRLLEGEDAQKFETWRDWCKSAVRVANQALTYMKERTPTRKRIERFASELARVVEESVSERWIVEKWSRAEGYTLMPVWSRAFAEKYLFRGVGKALLVSGTITMQTAEYLGLSEDECELVEVASSFSAKRRPFIYLPTVRVDHRMNDGDKRMLHNQIDRLIGDRLDRNGIVQSVSYGRAKEIKRASVYSELMLTHETHDRQRTVDEFVKRKDDPPVVLVSPSVEEGYDFWGDRARYQILPKIPMIDRRDPIIAARCEEDKKYPDYLTSFKIKQIYGRSMRSDMDWAEVILTDRHWEWFHKRVKWEKWFKKAWQKVERAPVPIKF
jgi:ATP-dependent DNA helicase DinG